MTNEEMQLLKRYLTHCGEIEDEDHETGFLCWYQDLRVYGEEGKREYKHALDLARVWETRYWAGWDDAMRTAVGHLSTDDVCHEPGTAHACSCPCHKNTPIGKRLLIRCPTLAGGGAHTLEWVDSRG